MKNLFTQKQPSTRREGVVKKLYGRLLLLAAMMMMAGSANAAIPYKIYDYDFEAAANNGWQITMSGTTYSANDPQGYWAGVYIGATFNGSDMSKLAFRYASGAANNSWWLANGLLYTNRDAYMVVRGLRAGDIVTITCTSNDALKYVKFDDNVHAVYNNAHDDFHEAAWGNTSIESDRPIHITSDGDLILKNSGYNGIKKIYIQSIKNATYKITKNGTNQTTFEFTGDGLMDYNDIAVPYMRVSFGHPSNYVTVNGLQSSIYGFDEQEKVDLDSSLMPYTGNFYAFNPTGSGHVRLDGSSNGVVYLFKQKNGIYYGNNGQYYLQAYYYASTIEFDVDSGYTYYICEDAHNTDNQAFYLHSFTFTNTFYLEPLAVIKDSSNPNGNLTTVHGNNVSINTTNSYVKRYSDNIDIKNLTMSLNSGQLSVSGIAFKDESQNKGGTIIYHLDTNEGVADLVITIPYSADWGTDSENSYGTRTWGHRWDFSNPGRGDSKITKCYIRQSDGTYALGTTSNADRLSIGRAGETSQLQEEIDKREWNYAQRVTGESGGFHDPMYTNVYDMEGDNADMIWETEGLWFETESNLSCLWNQTASNNYRSSVDPDRYVGLLPPETGTGAICSFTIPGLKDGDRVEIFLGSGEGSGTDIPYFTITGAKDALGTPITREYGFGGSMWKASGNSNYDYRSCYQFIKNGNDVPMKFTLTHGSMAKLYSIRIYRGDKSYQNNVTRYEDGVDGYQLLNTYKTGTIGSDGTQMRYQLHFRGKGESLYQPEVISQSGSLDLRSSRLWYTTDGHIVYYKSRIGDYGAFRMRLKCADFGGHYVADYADQTISVGYLEKMNYPYTWDFTDLKSWIDDYAQNDGLLKEWWHAAQTDDNKWVFVWRRFDAGTENEAYGLNVNHNSDRNVTRDQIRASGGQLYAGNYMLDETRGLGIETINYDKNYNDRLRIMSDGINISGLSANTWTFRIPEVPANGVVYVRGKKLGSPDTSHAEVLKCTVGSGEQQALSKVIEIANDQTGESVFVVKNTEGSAQDVRLIFNQIKVKRIAVSIDPKKVNVKGYASESRDHAIDASLLPYFTGEDMRTYLISEEPDYDEATVALTDMAQTANYVIPAGTGCIIRRVVDESEGAVGDKTFDVLTSGEGFHLFVPDMHDNESSEGKYADATANNQWLVPVVAGMENGVPYTNMQKKYVTLNHSGYDADGVVWYAWTWSTADDGVWVPEFDGKFIGLKSKAVFVRMNPAVQGAVPSWTYKYNQTSDITIEEGAAYQIQSWNDGSGNLSCQKVGTVADPSVDMTNYVLTYQYKKLNPDGSLSSQTYSGEEKFYRVHSGWNVKLRANSAYLQVPTEEVAPNGVNTTTRAHSFTFLFDGEEQQATAIDDLNVDELLEGEELMTGDNAEWYNLNGQKLNGRPAHRGLYIVNGKKVLVK